MSFVPPTNYHVLPLRKEVDDPFRFDPLGRVAFGQDPIEWAKNHIIALLLTSPGERVMRPTYGAGLRNFIFENSGPVEVQQLSLSISTALRQWEPSLDMVACDVLKVDPFQGLVELRIKFTMRPSIQVHTVQFTFDGTGIES